MPHLVSVTYKYVLYRDFNSTRQPRGANSGFTQLLLVPGGQYAQGSAYMFPGPSLPQTIFDPTFNFNFQFAFVNVSGGVGPEQNNPSTDCTKVPSVTVGTAPIVVLAVYAEITPPFPEPTGPLGQSGANIDAFDLTSNELVNNTFVASVTSPAGPLGGMPAAANTSGRVNTSTGAQTITALRHIAPAAGIAPPVVTADFVQWIQAGSQQMPPAGLDFIANQGTSPLAFACYRSH
jgi:hypothetical protein